MTGAAEKSLPYRPNSGAILRRTDGLILMCERLGHEDDIWQFPQGGVQPGETKEEAMWREVREELGLPEPRHTCELVAKGPPIRYDFQHYGPHYAGQEQTLFLLDFFGEPDDIQLDRFQTPEFASVRWVTLGQSLELIMDKKRHVLVETLDAISDCFS